MNDLSIKVTVDAAEAIAALDALVAAIGRAERALKGLTANVITNNAKMNNSVTTQQMADAVKADLHQHALSTAGGRIVADSVHATRFDAATGRPRFY